MSANSSLRKRVLLVEDQIVMQKVVAASLADVCELTWVISVALAESELKFNTYSLIILDVLLPDGSGFDFCQRVRSQDQYNSIPIIFLTGQADVDHRVHGFAIGADDYVVKPFEPKEFRARIEAWLKKDASTIQTCLKRNNFRLDLMAQKAFHSIEDGAEQNLNLTPIEFKLLAHLIKYEGQVFSREELMATVWGQGVHVSAHTVDTHISSLRKKIGDSGSHLKAILKRGYCLSFSQA